MSSSKLEDWNRRWRLLDDSVRCRNCQAEQPAHMRAEPFEHLPSCAFRIDGGLPWVQLDLALQATGASWH
jgi:hypothetical protein